MIKIQKKLEPIELKTFREENPNASFNYGLTEGVKPAIQKSLCEEQGFICAYCMKRIYPKSDRMRVEHFEEQENHKEKTLDYSNMLGVCTGLTSGLYHCDNFRGKMGYGNNAPLKYNPSSIEDFSKQEISYKSDGTIISSDKEFNEQLSTVLNLNNEILKENRKAIRNQVIKAIGIIAKNKAITKTQLGNILKEWTSKDIEGKYKEYFGVAVEFIEKRLKR